MPRKSNYVPSIIQAKVECYLCHKQGELELHHAIPGNGNRKICTELGLWVWLCPKCHRDLHDHNNGYKKIQADAQKEFIKAEMKKGLPESVCRDVWYERFRKFYDE